MSADQPTMPHSPYRAWLRVVAEIPEWRGDLQAKLEFFVAWRILNAP